MALPPTEITPRHHRVLYVTNNNAATDDVVSRAQSTFVSLNLAHESILHRDPRVIRTYYLNTELEDFPKKFTKIFLGIERQGIDSLAGVVWGVSDSIHAYSRKGRKMKGTRVSLAEVAACSFPEDNSEAQHKLEKFANATSPPSPSSSPGAPRSTRFRPTRRCPRTEYSQRVLQFAWPTSSRLLTFRPPISASIHGQILSSRTSSLVYWSRPA